jgi:predicted ATPase/DNA-binding SARP family transcriptional activator
LQIGVLGDVRVQVAGRSVPVKGQPGRLLAVLALHANRPVSAARLVDALWGDSPPPTARTALQVHVSRLRKLLDEHDGPSGLRTAGSGYVLDVPEDGIDALRFESLVTSGRQALDERRFEDARRLLAAGLALWRGRALADYEHDDFARALVARLDGIRLDAEDDLAEAWLECDRSETVVPILERLVEEQPLRERRWWLRMLALYRSGRQAEALRAYQQARRVLLEEIGVEPGRELQRLEHAILAQDPSLDLPSPEPDRSKATNLTNLPAAVTALVDRADELGEVERAIAEHRVVTITGPAGIGKTRLAVEAAAAQLGRHADGVWVVEVASISRPEVLSFHVGAALGIVAADDNLPTCRREVVEAFVADRALLIVLDNCEHLLSECADLVASLVRVGPRVRVLATSRERLGMPGEVVLRLGPLGVPPEETPAADLGRFGAARLFLDRATEVDPGLTVDDARAVDVARICRRLDGLPLALELAAAWARVLSIEAIAHQLDDKLLLAGPVNGVDRRRSLAQAIDASYAQLAQPHQRLFRRLAVFVGGFGLDTATAIGDLGDDTTAVDHLVALVDASLVHVEDHRGHRRYRLLEPIRQHALELLDAAGELDATRRRHAEHLIAVAEAAAPALRGPRQGEALLELEEESDNFRAALGWAVEHREHEIGQRLLLALAWPWYVRGHWPEKVRWFNAVISLDGADRSPWYARCLAEAANAGHTFTSVAARLPTAEAALARAEASGNRRDIAVASLYVGIGLGWLGEALDRAEEVMLRCLEICEDAGDRWAAAWARKFHGLLLLRRGDAARSYEIQLQALAEFEQLGDVFSSGHSLTFLGRTAVYMGDLDGARTAMVEGARRCESVGGRGTAVHALMGLAQLEAETGDPDRAAELFRRCLETTEAIGDIGCMAAAWRGLATLARSVGEHERALGLLRRSLLTSARLGHHGDVATTLIEIAGVAADAGRLDRAGELLGVIGAGAGASGIPLVPADEQARQRLLERAEAALGRDRLDALVAAGAKWSVDDAVAWVLDPGYQLT